MADIGTTMRSWGKYRRQAAICLYLWRRRDPVRVEELLAHLHERGHAVALKSLRNELRLLGRLGFVDFTGTTAGGSLGTTRRSRLVRAGRKIHELARQEQETSRCAAE